MAKVDVLLVLFLIKLATCDDTTADVEGNVTFVLYNKGQSSISTFKRSIADQGCDVKGNFALITHGWLGSNSPWIPDLISNLTLYRTGCIIFMNYSYYSDRLNYFEVISFFKPLANLTATKLNQLRASGVTGDQIFLFGFSFGGRIVIDAALRFGPNLIAQIDSKFIVSQVSRH